MKKYTVWLLTAVLVLTLAAGCGKATETNEEETKNVTVETSADAGLNWQEQYDLGIRLLNEGNYEDAILAFTAAIQINPKSAVSYLERANAYLAWADALLADAYASLGEGETLVWGGIGVSTSDGVKTLGDLYQAATDDYEKAVDLIESGESTDEVDAETMTAAADRQAEALIGMAESLLEQKDEPGVLDQILEYLEKADALTDDEELQKHIDALYDLVTTPAEARLPLGYRIVYEDSEDGSSVGWTKFYYDENGVLIGTAYVGDDGVESEMSPIYYDANGHKFPELYSSYAYVETDANGWITALGYSDSNISKRFTYDANGNLIQYQDGEYYRTEYIYDSENRLIQDDFYNVMGHESTNFYVYNGEGQLVKKTYTWYYSSGSNSNDINYEYDAAGRLVYQETLDSNGQIYIWTSYTYNSAGELVSEYHWYEPNPEWGGPYTYEYIYE